MNRFGLSLLLVPLTQGKIISFITRLSGLSGWPQCEKGVLFRYYFERMRINCGCTSQNRWDPWCYGEISMADQFNVFQMASNPKNVFCGKGLIICLKRGLLPCISYQHIALQMFNSFVCVWDCHADRQLSMKAKAAQSMLKGYIQAHANLPGSLSHWII